MKCAAALAVSIICVLSTVSCRLQRKANVLCKAGLGVKFFADPKQYTKRSKGLGNAKHTTQMRAGWSRPGVTKALRYKQNGTMVFPDSLTCEGVLGPTSVSSAVWSGSSERRMIFDLPFLWLMAARSFHSGPRALFLPAFSYQGASRRMLWPRRYLPIPHRSFDCNRCRGWSSCRGGLQSISL